MPHAFKAYPKHPTVLTLIQLHADLAGQIVDNEKRTAVLHEQIAAVEAVIKIFDPTFDLHKIAPKRRNLVNPFFKRGTMSRAVLDVLRGSQSPLTAREITMRILAAKGQADPERTTIVGLEGGVRSCLNSSNGKTVENDGLGLPRRWRLIG